MKEFSLRIQEAFTKGLSPKPVRSRANELGLYECHNLKPSPGGLIPFEPLTSKAIGLSISWPFPQLFIGSKYAILADETKIYEVNLSTWTKTEKLTVAAGTSWDFADFGDYFLMTNGTVMVYIDLVTDPTTPAYAQMASSSVMPRMGTVCNLNGQLIGGDIKTSWYDCSTDSIIWSKIGSADFTPDESNIAGYKDIPYPGNVLRIKELGSSAVVYCDNGIHALVPSGTQLFQFRNVASFGIAGRDAVGGDERSHVFVASNGDLYTLGATNDMVTYGLTPKKLDYNDYMSQLDPDILVVSYDSAKQEFYISDDEACYMLNESGLCSVYQLPTCALQYNGQSIGIFDSDGDTEGRFKTSVVDAGLRALKSMNIVEVGGESSADMYCSCDYKYDSGNDFAEGDWRLINPRGFVSPEITANEFRIAVKSSAFAAMKIDYLNLRMSLLEKTGIRGVYAS